MTRDSAAAVLTLASELAEMARLNEHDDHEATASRFVERLTNAVSGCDLAFVSVSRDGGFDIVAATGDPPVTTEDDSPIGEALQYREPRRLEDTGVDRRWPMFATRLALHGYRSCLVLPVPTEHSPTAVVTLLSRTAHQFDDHAYDIVLLVTLHAGVAFDNAQVFHDGRRMVQNLTSALHTRHTIGVAQGLVMRHFSCDTAGGFALLRQASQHANRKLRDIASELVSAHERGGFEEVVKLWGHGRSTSA